MGGVGGAVVEAPQMTQTIDDYGMAHRPPGPDEGAPLYDLTADVPEAGGPLLPDDFYSPDAARLYSSGLPELDREAVGIFQDLRGKPDASVTVYRAVPDELLPSKRIANLEKQKAYIMKKGKIPPGIDTHLGRSEYYEAISDEIESLKTRTDSNVAISSGDWVSITRGYARQHGESNLNNQYVILSKKVRAKEVFTNGDSIQEWGYWPQEGD